MPTPPVTFDVSPVKRLHIGRMQTQDTSYHGTKKPRGMTSGTSMHNARPVTDSSLADSTNMEKQSI